MITRILFGPGGGKCFSFIGAIDSAVDKGVVCLDNITCFGGVSGGALIAFCYCIGLTSKELVALVRTLHFDNLLDMDPNMFMDTFGLCNGNHIVHALRVLLEHRLKVQDITFAELKRRTERTLLVQVTNLSQKDVLVCDADKTPDWSVITTLRMSISIPFVFTPITHNDEFYVDGSLLKDTIDVQPDDVEKTLFFELQMSETQQPEPLKSSNDTTILDYSLEIFRTLITLYKSSTKRRPDNTCRVKVTYEPRMALMFPDAETIDYLINSGYQQFQHNNCECENLIMSTTSSRPEEYNPPNSNALSSPS
jgi:predicted acylesterase/phospholipase RssA